MKKVLSWKIISSEGLPYANRIVKHKNFSLMNTKNGTREQMDVKLQSLKGKAKLKFHDVFSNYYDETNFLPRSGNISFEEDSHSKIAQDMARTIYEALVFLKLFSD